MVQKMRITYVLSLAFSMLVYAVPFKYGGNLVRNTLVALIVGLLGYTLFKVRSVFVKEEIIPIALLLLNGITVLHFALIFFVVVFDPSHLVMLVIGFILALLIFWVINNRMNQHLNGNQ